MSRAIRQAVQCVRRLVDSLSQRWPEFNTSPVSVAFMLEEVSLGQVCLRGCCFSLSIIPPKFHAHSCVFITVALLSEKYIVSVSNTIKEMHVGSKGWAARNSATLGTSGAPPLPQRPGLVLKTIIRAAGGYLFWELIIKHVHNIHFGTRDSYTYVIFAIDIKGSSILSL